MVVASETSIFGGFMFDFYGLYFLSLLVEVESGSVLPLGLLRDDKTLQKPGFPDASVSGFHHCDGDPTPDIPACLGVGLHPIFGEAYGQALQHGLIFFDQQASHRDDKCRKVTPLLQTGVKVLTILVSF